MKRTYWQTKQLKKLIYLQISQSFLLAGINPLLGRCQLHGSTNKLMLKPLKQVFPTGCPSRYLPVISCGPSLLCAHIGKFLTSGKTPGTLWTIFVHGRAPESNNQHFVSQLDSFLTRELNAPWRLQPTAVWGKWQKLPQPNILLFESIRFGKQFRQIVLICKYLTISWHKK